MKIHIGSKHPLFFCSRISLKLITLTIILVHADSVVLLFLIVFFYSYYSPAYEERKHIRRRNLYALHATQHSLLSAAFLFFILKLILTLAFHMCAVFC